MVAELKGFQNPVFYPGLVVNFKIRLDNALQVVTNSIDDVPPGGITTTVVKPLFLQNGTDDQLSFALGMVPKAASIELAGYRQASKFSLTFAFQDFPLDPRTLRTVGVEIYLDAVSPQDWADGMTQGSLFDTPGKGKKRKSTITPSPDNLKLVGVVDSMKVEHGTGGAWVHFEGRDLKGLLLDTLVTASTLKNVQPTQNIEQVVKALVKTLPLSAGMDVQASAAATWPNRLVPSPHTLGDFTRAKMDAAGANPQTTTPGAPSKVTFWDLITNLCTVCGAVPYFIGYTLVIRPAETLFDVRKSEKDFTTGVTQTPFAGNVQRTLKAPLVKDPEQITNRVIVFGRDISSFNLERKLGGVKVPVIKCVSVNTDVKGRDMIVEAEFPEATNTLGRTTSETTGGQQGQTEIIPINIPGIKSRDRLLSIARGIHQEIGRQEITGSISTKNLASFGGTNQDPDLLRLMPGDPIEIRTDASGLGVFPPPISDLTNADSQDKEQLIKTIAGKIGDERLARLFVNQQRGEIVQAQRTFKVRTVKFQWAAESGVSIDFDFCNYIVARYGNGAVN